MNDPPAVSPAGARSYDELAARLQDLRIASGLSYRELHRRVLRHRRTAKVAEQPAFDTVYRCLQPGRARLDDQLVGDIALVLGAPAVGQWQRACRELARPDHGPTDVVTISGLPDRHPLVGRSAIADALVTALGRGDLDGCVITGMPGIGKTALAVEVAHRLLPRQRPDVVCFVDLLGFDPQRRPVPLVTTLEPLLRRLGVAPDQIAAADLRRRVALVHEVLAARPILLVFDNVREPAQIIPLLPGRGSPSRVVVTSRHRFDLAHTLTVALDVLTPGESAVLLSTGSTVPPDDPQIAELAALAGHLPLALAILVGRIDARPDWTLADHVEQLRAMRELHLLDAGVEASLWLSYTELTEADSRLLRLLARLPVSRIDAWVAASVAGLAVPAAEAALARLAAAHLLRQVVEAAAEPYGLHDVVRQFLAARSVETDPPRVRRQALEALYDYQVAATSAARSYYDPTRRPIPTPAGVAVPEFDGRIDATAWLERQRADLLAGAFSAIEHGRGDRAVELSLLLFGFLLYNSYLDDVQRLNARLAETTTGRDRAGALLSLGAAYGSAGRLKQARAPLEQALSEFSAVHDAEGVARALHNLGALCWELGDYPGAADYYRQVLESRAEGPAGTAMTVDNLGGLYARLGRFEEARACHEQALEQHRALGDRLKEGRTLGHLGGLAVRVGRLEEGRRMLDASLSITREVGDRVGELLAVSRLAELDSLVGNHLAAIEGQRLALAGARECAPDGEDAREVLVCLAAAYRRGGRLTEARQAQTEALAAARGAGDPYWTARALAEGAEQAVAGRDPAAAQRLRAEAGELFTRLGCPDSA